VNSAKARLNLAVKRLGMTKKAVADAVGIPASSYLSAMFSDNPHFARGGEKYWQPLAEFLGVTVAWLRFGEGAGPGATPPTPPPPARIADSHPAGYDCVLAHLERMEAKLDAYATENAELRERLARVEAASPASATRNVPSKKAGG